MHINSIVIFQVDNVTAIFVNADDSVKNKNIVLTKDNFEDMRIKPNNLKYDIFSEGKSYDYMYDLAPMNEPYHDKKIQYVAHPFRGLITWFSYAHHKEALANAKKKKKSNMPVRPAFSEKPLDDTYSEVK